MAGKPVHVEIPAGDTGKAREFWGSLFGWQFEEYAGSGYHMARISDDAGGAIYAPEGETQGLRVYFDVDDIEAGSEPRPRAGRRGRRCDARARDGLVRDLQGHLRQRVRPLADGLVRSGTGRVRPPPSPRPGSGDKASRSPSSSHSVCDVPPQSSGATSAIVWENVQRCPPGSWAVYWRSPYG